ncbi:MAG TPA: FkbM family methyltransferase [Candidatus Hydrogenedentes bacterium]|nr:FkbM family methyltransferase [Candidatus Hydrogenedentota bacterium]
MEINTVIDIGASDGQWSAKIQERFFSDAKFLLIEGYDFWLEALERRKAKHKNFDYVVAAAGDEVGKIYYCKRPDHPTGGHAHDRKIDDRYEEANQTTVDFEVQKRGLKGPFMVKLDCHGREHEILQGAEKTLEQTELLMVEVYNYADRGRMRFHQLITFAEEHGFRCVDLAEPHFMEEGYSKNADLSLWAMDLFFVRGDRPEFNNR